MPEKQKMIPTQKKVPATMTLSEWRRNGQESNPHYHTLQLPCTVPSIIPLHLSLSLFLFLLNESARARTQFSSSVRTRGRARFHRERFISLRAAAARVRMGYVLAGWRITRFNKFITQGERKCKHAANRGACVASGVFVRRENEFQERPAGIGRQRK